MDKNYNVDDILDEIKRRKVQEKRTTPPTVKKTAPPAKPKFELQPPELWELPKSEPVATAEPEDKLPNPTPLEPKPDSSATAAFTPPIRSKPKLQNEDLLPLFEEMQEPSRNPLDPDGHGRSLTDRARIRRERGTRPFRQPEQTEAGGTEHKTEVIDFSAFRPDPAQAGHDLPDNHGHTRILQNTAELSRSREFQLDEIRDLDFGAAAEHYYDYNEYEEEEEYVPSAPPLDHGEYNSVADRDLVAQDIARVKLWLFIRCVATAILTGALYYVVLAGNNLNLSLPDLIQPEVHMKNYLFSIVLLTVLLALINSSTVGGGIISLFKLRANFDTLPALAVLGAIGQGVVLSIHHQSVTPDMAQGIFACVAALAMFFNALGKTSMISRIQQNFRLLASEREKRAVLPVPSQDFARHFVRDSAYRPTVAYSVKADFFTDFLGLSYSDKYDVGINRGVAPACLISAVLVGIVTYLLVGSPLPAVSAVAAILCVSATFSSSFIENIPLGKLTRKLAPLGGMVSGNKAVEDFCDTHAVILREQELFPEGHIQLHGIKAYSHGRIDEAILDAASVLCATESALRPVFLDMIGGNQKLLKEVDNVVYENEMGVSAWVNSRRVLIGNSQLMHNHGISIPQDDYSTKYADQHGEVLYLSNSGEVSAQFVISYHIDEELAASLDHLATLEKRLIIYTVDPNLTPYKLWELYGYPEELVDILPAELHDAYSEMVAPQETAIAEIVYTGKASVMVRSILACVSARASILAATIIQLVQIALGYGLIAFIAILGALETLTVLQLTLYQLFWFVAIFAVQKVRAS